MNFWELWEWGNWGIVGWGWGWVGGRVWESGSFMWGFLSIRGRFYIVLSGNLFYFYNGVLLYTNYYLHSKSSILPVFGCIFLLFLSSPKPDRSLKIGASTSLTSLVYLFSLTYLTYLFSLVSLVSLTSLLSLCCIIF